MQLLSTIPDSFVLPEPYYDYELSDDTNAPIPTSLIPTLESLFDCSFLDDIDKRQHVFWKYACQNIPYVSSHPPALDHCYAGILDRQWLLNKCMHAERTIIKSIRLPFLTRRFPLQSLIPDDARVVYVIRKPWDIVHSQHELGWYKQEHFTKMVPLFTDPLAFHTGRVCEELNLHDSIIATVPRANVFLLRYEDLHAEFDSKLEQLFGFVGSSLTETMRLTIKNLRTLKFASEPIQPENLVDVSLVRSIALTSPACPEFLQEHYPAEL